MKTAATTMTKQQEETRIKKHSPFLRKRGTTTVFPWTETLARRSDMDPYWPEQGGDSASRAASLSGMAVADARKGERPPFLRKHGTNTIFPWTETLSKRGDMEAYWPPVEGADDEGEDVPASDDEGEDVPASDEEGEGVPASDDESGTVTPGPGLGGLMQHAAPLPSLIDPGPPPSLDTPKTKTPDATEESLKAMSMLELRAYAREKYQMTFPPSTRQVEILTEMIGLLNEETINLSAPAPLEK